MFCYIEKSASFNKYLDSVARMFLGLILGLLSWLMKKRMTY